MPESGEIAPIVGGYGFGGIRREHFRSELGSPPSDFIQMAVIGFEITALIASLTLALIRGLPEGGEERLPFGRVAREIRMGVCVGGQGDLWRLVVS